jgi:hypothetical protein
LLAKHGQTENTPQIQTLHSECLVQGSGSMKKKLSLCGPLLFSSLLLAGCTTTVTNLTPSTETRNQNGLYPFEVALDTREHSIRRTTLKPFVLVGSQAYPMQPTFGLQNRWETLVPVPADREYVNYRFKFNYLTRSFKGTPSSKLSRPFQLQVLDK